MIEWNYAGDADITIGEVRISRTAKVILIILIIILCICMGASIYFRHYIFDFISNPQVVLSSNTITLEVNSELNPEKYIIGDTSAYTYTVDGLNTVNTKKLGKYTITYNSKNLIKSNSVTLIIKVVDTTAPEITLTEDALKLVRGTDTDNFNAKNYLKEVKDNYSKAENIKIDFTNTLNFDNDEVEVLYSATDEAGNIATAKLSIIVVDSEDDLIADYEKQRQAEEEAKRQAEEESRQQEESKQQATEAPTQKQTEAQTEAPTQETTTKENKERKTEAKPYIKGVKDITVSVGTSTSDIVSKLVSGVSGSGYVSCDYSSVNPTVAGTYPVYWSSDDGASATSYVTVKE